MSPVRVQIQRLDADLPLPAYAHPGDAGADLRARSDVRLEPGERALVPTGVAIAVPDGYVGLVHPRSGLAHRHGLTVLNAPGTIDAGYRGEVFVNLVNLDPHEAVVLRRGDRIAQLVLQAVERAEFVETAQLAATARGEDGHGSTGLADSPTRAPQSPGRSAPGRSAPDRSAPGTPTPGRSAPDVPAALEGGG